MGTFILQACSYLREKVRHPKFNVRVNLPPLRFDLGVQQKVALRPDYKRQLGDQGLELLLLDLGRWSNRLRGNAVLLFCRNSDGKLSHTRDGQQLRFGGQGLDPPSVVVGYEGNTISVNGFRMSLKGMNKILGTSKDKIAMLFGIDVSGDDSVVYDVARERITGSGGILVRQLFRDAVLGGLEETGIYDQLDESTKDLIRRSLNQSEPDASADPRSGLRRTRFAGMDEDLLKSVSASIPDGPWPQGLHKTIAAKLGISNGLASDAINHLLAAGTVAKPGRQGPIPPALDGRELANKKGAPSLREPGAVGGPEPNQ